MADDIKLLSGEELVEKGATKNETTLPMKGAKDVLPNKTWLEQKQIQVALEARRHLLADERIEKWGVLSHAVWDDKMQLARVTEQKGCRWEYLGHSVDKQIYLYPEEALFLMEINCLELKFGGIQVSLQQAYSLLLSGQITILEYRVYAELSRIGYRVLRYNPERPEINIDNLTEYEKQINLGQYLPRNKNKFKVPNRTEENSAQTNPNTEKEANSSLNSDIKSKNQVMSKEVTKENVEENIAPVKENGTNGMENSDTIIESTDKNIEKTGNGNEVHNVQKVYDSCKERKNIVTSENDKCVNNITSKKSDKPGNLTVAASLTTDWRTYPPVLLKVPKMYDLTNDPNEEISNNSKHKSQRKLENKPSTRNPNLAHPKINMTSLKFYRGLKHSSKPLSSLCMKDHFECVSNIQGKDTVIIMAPDEEHLPRNIFLNQTEYALKIDKIVSQTRPTHSNNSSETLHNRTDIDNMRCLQNVPRQFVTRSTLYQQRMPQTFFQQPFFPPFAGFPFNLLQNRIHNPYRFNIFNGLPHMLLYQRPYYMPRFNHVPYQRNYANPARALGMNSDNFDTRKRQTDPSKKEEHLQAIRKLACRLKQFIKSGNRNEQNISSLNRLICSFNTRYNENLILTEHCTILNDCNDSETIDLDKDESEKKKRRRNDSDQDSQKKICLDSLKSLALKLKQIKASGEAHFRSRRMLLKAIKTFNKKFHAKMHLTSEFGIKDHQQIVLDSSSDSDCIIADNEEITSKDMQTPFSAKNRATTSAKHCDQQLPSTSKDSMKDNVESVVLSTKDYNDKFQSVFKKWLPDMEEWGRADVVLAESCQNRILSSNQNQYLFGNFEGFLDHFQSWLDLKNYFWESLDNSVMEVDEEEISDDTTPGLQPLLRPEDCSDVASVLRRLAIVKSYRAVKMENSLKVQFDVYERDVKNFRKTDIPIPSFRIICLSEQIRMPSISELLSLQDGLTESAPLVIAVVGIGSVSYMQVTASDLPVYIKQSLI